MRLKLAAILISLAETANAECKQVQCMPWSPDDFNACKYSIAPTSTNMYEFREISVIITGLSFNDDCSTKMNIEGEKARKLGITSLKVRRCMFVRKRKGSSVTIVAARRRDGSDWRLSCPSDF